MWEHMHLRLYSIVLPFLFISLSYKTNFIFIIISILGGSGFLGQNIIKLLQECDPLVEEIRVLDLRPYENKLGKSAIFFL